MSDHFLPYFITEDLYLINEPKTTYTKEQPEAVTSQEKSIPDDPIKEPKHHPIVVISGSMSAEDQTLLTKVLEAVSVKITDVHILENTAFLSGITFDKMLVFQQTKDKALYSPAKSSQGEVLYSKPLAQLHTSREDKLLLWNALKNWFTIG